jgi:hypothetical protein
MAGPGTNQAAGQIPFAGRQLGIAALDNAESSTYHYPIGLRGLLRG